ncbi:MAG: SpoIIE family protein phosphatase [Rhodobacterales bacterium]|nr:SpoIIE family protein phosphatase [Rhodobacterales bacterium]
MIFRSLTGKTLAVYLPMVLASVVAVFAIQSWNYHREQEQELIEQLRSLTAVQSTTLAQAVWEFDSESIESAINQIMKLPIMRDAVVRDETGTNIIAMGAWDKPPEKPAYRLARDIVYHEQTDSQIIGQVILGVTGHQITAQLYDNALLNLRVLAALLVALTAATLITNRLFIGRPLALLKQAIETRRGNEDSAEPIAWKSSDELGLVVGAYTQMCQRQKETNRKIKDYQAHLEELVQQRTAELHASIEYASRIQRSFLPTPAEMRQAVSQFMVLWEPRDVVGGDLYWCRRWRDGHLLMLGDCTGHGVPGALMTLVCSSILDRAEDDAQNGGLADLTQRIHHLMRAALGQDSGAAETDDGMELGLCHVRDGGATVDFVGARMDLYVAEGGEVTRVRGTRTGIAYPEVPEDQEYTCHQLAADPARTYYMVTDGILDQVGGPDHMMFGRRRFTDLLARVSTLPLGEQAAEVRRAFVAYQGPDPRRDDISLLGFRL